MTCRTENRPCKEVRQVNVACCSGDIGNDDLLPKLFFGRQSLGLLLRVCRCCDSFGRCHQLRSRADVCLALFARRSHCGFGPSPLLPRGILVWFDRSLRGPLPLLGRRLHVESGFRLGSGGTHWGRGGCWWHWLGLLGCCGSIGVYLSGSESGCERWCFHGRSLGREASVRARAWGLPSWFSHWRWWRCWGHRRGGLHQH
mmetsp:Transcript_74312/g.154947  ORF Transcript_74312/g.154947 Transcript_74312/m.154947 type:complete len:200 (-) Transcript_74312:902-1501(-)